MSNMSYCRFENTAHDLEDCYENWESLDGKNVPNKWELSSRKRILELCKQIVEEHGGDE